MINSNLRLQLEMMLIMFSIPFMDTILQYKGVRIFVSGENVSPNFLISDYAMTFDRLEFGDRYVGFLIKLYREPTLHYVYPVLLFMR